MVGIGAPVRMAIETCSKDAGAPVPCVTGSRKRAEAIAAAERVRDADPAAGDGEDGEQHERNEH